MFRDLLSRIFSPYGTLTPRQLDHLESHYHLLETWNRKLNLIRFRSLQELIELHYCESLYLATRLPVGDLRIADLGSGAGFPGIPFAVFRPECQLALIESHQRKAVFLREAIRGLRNCRVIAERAEDVQESFDWVVSRAVLSRTVIESSLAGSIAILMSEADAAGLDPRWEVSATPWGNGRVLGMFHVEH